LRCVVCSEWVGTLAEHMLNSWGADYAGRIRWRLGTESNGPRWTNRGEYEAQYLI
jgi:hypothetical protein